MTNKLSKTKSSIKGFIWMFFGNSLNMLSQLLIIGILARLLTPVEFGIISIILLFVNFSDTFNQMGIGAALIQFKTLTNRHISIAYSLSVIIGIFIGILFYYIAPYVGLFFNLKELEEPIRFFSFFFPLKSFNSISTALLQRELKFSCIVKSNSLSYLLGYGLTSVTLAFLGFGLWSLIYGQLAILIVNTMVLLYYQKPNFSLHFDKKICIELLTFGSGLTIDSNFNFLAENSDNIIVGKILGASSLGIYSKAFQFLSLPASFFGGIYDKILFPILSSAQDNIKKLTSFYIFSISFCLLVLFPVSLLLMLNAELIITILLGNQWLSAIEPFQVLIFGFCFRFGTRINKSFLKSLGLVYRGAYYQFIFFTLMVTSCLIGVYFFGIIGVAIGVLITTVINYIQVSYRIHKLLDFEYSYFIKLHIKSFILYSPILMLISALFIFNYFTIATSLILSALVVLPLMFYSIKSKRSIFFESHNLLILNQLYDNSPSSIKNVLSKFNIYK